VIDTVYIYRGFDTVYIYGGFDTVYIYIRRETREISLCYFDRT